MLAQSARSIVWLGVLLDASVKGVVILAAAGVLTVALRRASAALRHLIWSLAMVSLLVVPLLSAVLPNWQVPILPRPVPAPQSVLDVGRSGVPPDRTILPERSEGAGSPRRVFDETPALPVLMRDADPTSAASTNEIVTPPIPSPKGLGGSRAGFSWPILLLLTWVAGAVAAITPLFLGMVGVWRRARRAEALTEGVWARLLPTLSKEIGLDRRVTLLKSDHAAIPTTWGILRPIVLLPSEALGWSAERCRIVLLHELAHIRRCDWLTQMVARFARALYWFNPLAWFAARRMRVESEQACDDSVLRAGHKPSVYADQLLEIVRTMRPSACESLATVPIACQSRIQKRLAAILDAGRNRRRVTRAAVTLAALAIGCIAVPVAAIRPVAKETRADEVQEAGPSRKAAEGGSVAHEPRPEDTDEAASTTVHLSEAAERGIQARSEYLRSKQVLIEYTHTIERDEDRPPLRYDCTLLLHGGNYREERRDLQGRTVHNYFCDGLRVEVGQLWKGKAKRQGSDELAETRFLMGLPPHDATDVVAVAPRVSYHSFSLKYIVDGTIVEQWTEPSYWYFAEMKRRGAVTADQVIDGIRCVRFDDDRNARYYAPDLGWALVGTGPHTGSYRAVDFEKTGDVYFPKIITRGRPGRGRESVEIKNIAIADEALFSPESLVPPHEPEEGAVVEVLCPVAQGSEVIIDELGYKPYNFRWSRDLSPEDRRFLTVSMSRWRMRDFEEALDAGFPLPFYDEARKLIVWAKHDRDLSKYLRIHEGDEPPGRFGAPPWNDLLDLVSLDSKTGNVLVGVRGNSTAEQDDFPGSRMLHFPDDWSIGVLRARDIGAADLHGEWWSEHYPSWEFHAAAERTVMVPAGKELALSIRCSGWEDFWPLAKLRPGDVDIVSIECFGKSSEYLEPLSSLTWLETLQLSQKNIDNEDLRWLKRMGSMKRLSLFAANLNDEGLAHVGHLKSLKSLRISGEHFTDAGLAHLSNLDSLEEVFLGRRDTLGDGLAHLVKLPRLERLDFYAVTVSGAGAAHLSTSTSLKELNFNKSDLTPEDLGHIAAIPNLETLRIHRMINDEAVDRLSSARSLKKLLLGMDFQDSRDLITDVALASLSKVSSLESLGLYYGKFTDKGLEHLSELPKLRSLAIPNCRTFTDAGLEHLSKLSHLEHLDLRRGNLSDAGLKRLKEALPNCHIDVGIADAQTNGAAEATVRVSTEPNRAMFTIDGPIPVGTGIKLVGAESRFVAPDKVRLVMESGSNARAFVRFAFLGEEDPDRLINLQMVFKDSSGNLISSMTRQCADRRIEARKEALLSAWVFRPTALNSETFRFDALLLEQLSRIELTFEEL